MSTLGMLLMLAVYNISLPSISHLKLMMTLGNYMSSITFNGTHTGVIPGVPPVAFVGPSSGDMVNGSALSGMAIIPPATDKAFDIWIDMIYNAIKANVYIVGTTSIAIGLIPAFPTMTRTWKLSQITSDSRESTWKNFGDLIVKDLLTNFVKTYPSTYINGSVGATVVTSIVCP